MIVIPGNYVRFDGGEYVVIGVVTSGETLEEMALYHPVGDGGLLVYPASKWSEPIEHDGRTVKRFRSADEIVCAPNAQEPQEQQQAGITKHSSSAEKIELFMSLFTGRSDVYAKRWENAKKETAGYVPDCYNEWKPLCPKSGGGKIKCGDCPVSAFKPFDAVAVENHLTGIRSDHMLCCPTKRAASLRLITYAMNKNHMLTLKTYDRLIPAQDTLPNGGFGNLIGLPLQKVPRGRGGRKTVGRQKAGAQTNICGLPGNCMRRSRKYAVY